MQEEITRWGRKAFQTTRELEIRDPVERTTFVAITCGAHAARKGMSEVDLVEWLQSNYSALFVKESSLNPGLDLREVHKILMRSYQRHKEFGRGGQEKSV